MKLRAGILLCIVALAAYAGGALTVHKKLFPFHEVRAAKRLLHAATITMPERLRLVDAGRACTIVGSDRVDAGEYVWELLTNRAAYGPRDGAGGLVHDGRMFLIGGWNPEDLKNFPRITSNDVWVSSDGVMWTMVKPNSFVSKEFDPVRDWEGRHSGGYVVHDGYMWIVGGDAIQGRHQGDIWKSRDGKQWELVNSSPPWAPRALHSTIVFDGHIYVIGGQTIPLLAQKETVGEHYYRDVWRSRDGVVWERVQTNGPLWRPRGGAVAVVFKDKIWLAGGFTYEGHINKNRDTYSDVWSSSDGKNWDLVTNTPAWGAVPGGFMFHDVAVFDEKMWIIGGARKGFGNTNEVWMTADGKNWQRLGCSPMAPTHATTVFRFNGGLVVSAGNHMTRHIWRLTRKTAQPVEIE